MHADGRRRRGRRAGGGLPDSIQATLSEGSCIMAGMGAELTAGGVIREFWARLDAADWAGLGALLDPGLRVHYPHNGEEMAGPAAFVRRNSEFPGRWHVTITDFVEQGDRVVSCAQISDGTADFYVASFATVRGGLVAELTEVWTEERQRA
jgi:hypothetical protein